MDSLSLSDLMHFFVGLIPVGFLVGCIPMVIGACIHGIFAIFKRV